MKHLKLFEDKKVDNVIVTTVDFTGGGDGVYALYIDGILEFYGDPYHDNIQDKIKGFILGLKWIKENYVYPLKVVEETFKVTDEALIEDISDMGRVPPKELKSLR